MSSSNVSYLVDTNVLSEALRGTREAVHWVQSVPPDSLRISVISLGEIMHGAVAKRRKDPVAGDRLLAWVSTLRTDFVDRIENIDDSIAIEWGRFAAVRSRGAADGLIAVTAAVRNLTLVTRNVAGFADLPLRIIDPWRLEPS